MKFSGGWFGWAAMLALGCSAGDPEGDSMRRGGGAASPGEPMGAGDAPIMSGGPGDFGNSNATPVDLTSGTAGEDGAMQTPGDAQECEVGVFCAPTEPDPDNCGTLRLESDVEVTRTPGNLLVIFDQSGSMDDGWGATGTSKLQAAQMALVNAITPLQDMLTVGAIFFPTFDCVPFLPPPPGTGAVAPIDGPGQIPFQAGPQFLSAWQQHWTAPRTGLGIGTPMQEAFDRADVAIQNAMLEGSMAVVAFTDGEPNCFPDPNISGPTMLEPQRASGWLSSLSIQTHVVGLPGAGGVQILDQVAQSGGTGTYILPDDPAQLEAVLSQVVQETVMMGFDSCSISLTPAADVPEELLMIVEEPDVGKQQVPRDRGWSLSDDGVQVEITGALCDDAMGGRFSSITFEYACPEAPPPPPLPPVE